MVTNYQLLVELKLRRNPVASIDKLLVELKIAEKSNIIIRGAKLTEEIQGVPITVEAHIYKEIQHN